MKKHCLFLSVCASLFVYFDQVISMDPAPSAAKEEGDAGATAPLHPAALPNDGDWDWGSEGSGWSEGDDAGLESDAAATSSAAVAEVGPDEFKKLLAEARERKLDDDWLIRRLWTQHRGAGIQWLLNNGSGANAMSELGGATRLLFTLRSR